MATCINPRRSLSTPVNARWRMTSDEPLLIVHIHSIHLLPNRQASTIGKMSMTQRKQEKDYTSEVSALQPEAEQLAKVS